MTSHFPPATLTEGHIDVTVEWTDEIKNQVRFTIIIRTENPANRIRTK